MLYVCYTRYLRMCTLRLTLVWHQSTMHETMLALVQKPLCSFILFYIVYNISSTAACGIEITSTYLPTTSTYNCSSYCKTHCVLLS